MKKDPRLPPCVYHQHGAYYLVKRNKWTRLGKEFHEALAAYGRIMTSGSGGGMTALLEETLRRAEQRVKPSTYAKYRSCGKKIGAAFMEFHPAEVKQIHILQFLDHYRNRPSTANNLRAVLKLAFEVAIIQGQCETNPVIGTRPMPQNKRDRYLSDNEYKAIWDAANPVMRCIMDLCYLTGQRVGDVL
ncbi:MAG: hypothetical protein GY792_13090 [Gammaproteobacteria bacterium]|nr:hypothetical protein [Gammaproteobacteria bacterium]